MNTSYPNTIESACHCGNIHLELHTHCDNNTLTPRTCQCSLCRKHGASWISDPEGEVHVRFREKEAVSFYRFGHGTSDFILCEKCGTLMIAVCEIDGKDRAVLNATAMTDEVFPAAPVQTNFDAEDVDDRLTRRAKNWTGTVKFIG